MKSPARLPRGRQPAFCPLPSWQWAAAASFRLTVILRFPGHFAPFREEGGVQQRPSSAHGTMMGRDFYFSFLAFFLEISVYVPCLLVIFNNNFPCAGE